MIDDRDAIAELVGFVHVVGREQYGQIALRFDLLEHLPDRDARDGIEPRPGTGMQVIFNLLQPHCKNVKCVGLTGAVPRFVFEIALTQANFLVRRRS